MGSANKLPRIGAPATRALADVGIFILDDLRGKVMSELATLHEVGPKAVQLLQAALDEQP